MSVILVVAHEEAGELGRLTELVRGLGYAALPAASVARLRSALSEHNPAGAVCSSAIQADLDAGDHDPTRAWVVLDNSGAPPSEPALEDGCERIQADAGTLESALQRALARAALEAERARMSAELHARGPHPLFGQGAPVRRLRDQIERIAGTPRTTALILGEPGTGRARLARELHDLSARRAGPFVLLDASRLPEGQLSEQLSAGVASRARGGTLVVHRVEALDACDQQTLAALVQDRTWTARPSELELPLEARLVATSSPDLEQRVDQGRFREDLFSRLNVMSACITPLRERGRDILLLAEQHLDELAATRGLPAPALDPGARDQLTKHAWTSNEIELRDVLARALTRFPGRRQLGPDQLDLAPPPSTAPLAPHAANEDALDVLPLGDRSWRFVEEALIRRVLAEVDGNRSRAARILGVNRTTLYNKLRSYEIDD